MTLSQPALRTLLLLLGAVACACACATRAVPRLDPPPPPPEVPVVLVPGISGNGLRHAASGEVAWGDAASLFLPRDGGLEVALPLDDRRDGLVPGDPLLRISLLGIVRPVYGPVIRAFEAAGYRAGDLDAPEPGDTFFFFTYDWRHENVEAAAGLAGALERLASARRADPLEVDLVCQSNAASICRWLVKYGSASIEEARAGATRPPQGVRVRRLILVGTANGGTLRTLLELDHGRRYIPLAGRRFTPEVLFTFRSLFESLPAYFPAAFFDVDGRPLPLNVFDPEAWVRHGFSIFERRVARRADRHPAVFGDATTRLRYLERRLDRARELHRLLQADPPGFEPPLYVSIQDGFLPSPERLLVLPGAGGSRLRTHRARRVRSDPWLLSLARDPGDGHATLDSQSWLSPREIEALAAPPLYFEGGHFDVILNPAAQRRLLQALLD